MLLSILLLAAQAEQMGAIVFEPQPASPWVETFSASCGGQHLEILRPMRPLENGPKVLVNGRPAHGDVRPLELELSEVGAAYRMSFACSQDGELMELRWVRGLVGEDGQVSFRAGSAAFRKGALVGSRSEETNKETFWYR